MSSQSSNCYATIIGAGPYGLSAAAFLRDAGVEARSFGDPMSFWGKQMPEGMFLRSNWGASHIADPRNELTLDSFCKEQGNHCPRPIPLNRFVAYGQWYQRKAVPGLDSRMIHDVSRSNGGFRITLSDGETFQTKRVIVATGISRFAHRPSTFEGIPPSLASHTGEHRDLSIFRGRTVAVIGAGQSATESAALLHENGAEVEVLARQNHLNWVGLHPRLHHLGAVSRLLYSDRDVGPAGLSRLVAAPHVFRRFPRGLQSRMAYRAIRPAAAGWLAKRIEHLPITFGCHVTNASVQGDKIQLRFDNGTTKIFDHVILATGFRVDVTRYDFLSESITKALKSVNGYPVLKRGLESSIPGLHFLGKPAAWSFGPLVGFVSGAEFASRELLKCLQRDYRRDSIRESAS
jgi:FAD-dependent urate hydroxylase